MYILYEDENYRFVLIGKIDLSLTDNQYVGMPMDHKSYERDSELLRWQNQFTNYCIAMNTDLLYVNRIGFQVSKKPAEKHKRIPIQYDDAVKAAWRKNTIKWFWKYVDALTTKDYDQNPTSCNKFNKKCEYYSVCDSGDEDKERKILTLYKEGEVWDVSKILGVRE
jgi:hypothetical protein